MTNIIDCTFNSVWDNESSIISSDAKIDLDTGRIFDIKAIEGVDMDGVEVETLDREYIDFVGINSEFEVKHGDNGDYVVCDLPEIVMTLQNAENMKTIKF